MLLAVGDVRVGPFIKSLKKMAMDINSHHEHNQKKGLGTHQHRDGWGLAYLDQKGNWRMYRSMKAVFNDKTVQKFNKVRTKVLILHARYGSVGKVALSNTHPFRVRVKNKSFIFAHNGTVKRKLNFSSSFKPRGETDSEQLFYSILTKSDQLSSRKDELALDKAIIKTFQNIPKNTNSNIILSDKDKSYVYSQFVKNPTYMRMHIGQGKNMIVVSSEKLILPKQDHVRWKDLPKQKVVQVNHSTRKNFVLI